MTELVKHHHPTAIIFSRLSAPMGSTACILAGVAGVMIYSNRENESIVHLRDASAFFLGFGFGGLAEQILGIFQILLKDMSKMLIYAHILVLAVIAVIGVIVAIAYFSKIQNKKDYLETVKTADDGEVIMLMFMGAICGFVLSSIFNIFSIHNDKHDYPIWISQLHGMIFAIAGFGALVCSVYLHDNTTYVKTQYYMMLILAGIIALGGFIFSIIPMILNGFDVSTK